MYQLLLLMSFAPLMWAQWSLQFDGRRVEASGGLANGLKNVRALRMEMRIHDFQLRPPTGQQVLIACNQFLQVQGNSQFLRLTDFAAGGESHVHDMTNRKDIIIRIQHMLDQGQTLFEIWDADGKNYAVQRLTGRRAATSCERDIFFGSNGRGDNFFNGSIAYFRWFETVVPNTDGPSSSPAEAIVAYEFEQNGTEAQGGRALRISGGSNFVQSPIYPPLISIRNGNRTVNANEPTELDGSGSLAVGGSIVSWQWEQVRGPVPVIIENANTSKALITGATQNGTYEFSLAVTDSLGQTSKSSGQLGVVPTDEYGIVKVADPAMAFALGPLVRSGVGPWPYYEQIRNSMGQQWGEAYPSDPPGEKDYRTGTITLTPGSKSVRGTGTTFLRDFLDPPVFISGSTVSLTTGALEIRGAGTQFFQTFLKDIRTGTGVARIDNNSDIVDGDGTKFREQFEAGNYILLNTPGSGFNPSEERAFKIVKVLDDRSLQIDKVWRGGDLARAAYRAARDSGKILVVEEASNKLSYFSPSVQTNTSIAIPTVFTGTSAAGLRFGSAKADGYNHIIIHYPVEEEGKQGRMEYYFTSIVSDTELIISPVYSGKLLKDVPFGRAKGEDLAFWQDGLNYYDSTLVHYQNYYRTGLDNNLTYARRLADAWYTMFDSGRSGAESPLPPRMVGISGLICRALDGRPDMWPMIRRAVRYNYDIWVGQRRDYPGLYYGIRDGGFSLNHAAVMAKVDPDPNQRAAFLAMARDGAVNLYARLQKDDGSWRWRDDAWKGFGEQPFHVGLLLEGMIATHRQTQDPAILQAILRAADHLIAKQQPAPCRSPVYALFNDDGPWGYICTGPDSKPSSEEIKDSRAGNNTIMHAIGYAYAVTGLEKYKVAGDDMFSATFGNRQGPGADEYWGRADTTMKQYGQSFRAADAYLAYTLPPFGSMAIPDL